MSPLLTSKGPRGNRRGRLPKDPNLRDSPKSYGAFGNYVVSILIKIILNISWPNSKFFERIKRTIFSGSQLSGFSVCNFIMTSSRGLDLFHLPRPYKALGGPAHKEFNNHTKHSFELIDMEDKRLVPGQKKFSQVCCSLQSKYVK